MLLITLVGVPAFFLWGFTYDAYNVPKLALVFTGTGIAAIIRLSEIGVGAPVAGLRRLVFPASCFAVPLTLSWLATPYKEWALFGLYQRFQGLIPYLAVITFGILLADAFVGRASQIAWGLAIGGGIVAIYGSLELFGIDPLRLSSVERGWTLSSTIGNPNFVGGYLGITLPVAVGLWLRGGGGSRWAAFLTVVIVNFWLLAQSEGGWAGGIAGLSVTVGLILSVRWAPGRRLGFGMSAAVALAVTGVVVFSMIAPNNESVSPSIQQRARWWQQAVRMAADSPLAGRGPNTFAVDGPQYRLASDAIDLGQPPTDDPHSVPLSFLANAGTLGLLGYLLVAVWVLRHGVRPEASSSLGAIFIGACIAYLVQSIGSIDELSLRTAFWGSLAGLAISDASSRPHTSAAAVSQLRHRSSRTWALGLLPLSLLPVWSASGFIRADHGAELARIAFSEERFDSAFRNLEKALAFRDEYEYREMLGFYLGRVAVARGAPEGLPLIDRMNETFDFLDSFPSIGPLIIQARSMFQWSAFDPAASRKALELFERAQRLDRHNPLLALATADVLTVRGHYADALNRLEPFAAQVPARTRTGLDYSELWGGIAINHAKLGQVEAARAALRRAETEVGCHVQLARVLLQAPSKSTRARPTVPLQIRLLCPRVMLELLPDPKN